MPRQIGERVAGQVFGQFARHLRAGLRIEAGAQLAERLGRRDQHQRVEIALARRDVEQAGHVAGELLLLELVPVGRLHGGAAAIADGIVAAPRLVAAKLGGFRRRFGVRRAGHGDEAGLGPGVGEDPRPRAVGDEHPGGLFRREHGGILLL